MAVGVEGVRGSPRRPPATIAPIRSEARSRAPVLRRWIASSASSVPSVRPSAWRSAICPPTIPAGPAASARARTQPAAASAGRTCRAMTSKASVSRPSPARIAVASSNALWQVGRPRRRSSSSIAGQVVVDQRIRVDHLQRTGRRQRRGGVRRRRPRPPSGRAPAGAACRPPARCSASPRPAAPGRPPPDRPPPRAGNAPAPRPPVAGPPR